MHTCTLTAPEIAISPVGIVQLAVGDSFFFDCLVTTKIPPLPIEVYINGNLDTSRTTTSAPRFTAHPTDVQEYLFQSVSVTENGTAIECRTFVTTSSETITTSSDQIMLSVSGRHITIGKFNSDSL